VNIVTLKRVKRSIASGLISLLAAGPTWADFSCLVNVLGVIPCNGDLVNVLHSGRGNWTMICSLTETYASGLTVKPETCAMWTALLLQAKKDNTPVTFYFAGSGTCSEISLYTSAPVPIYIGLTQ
jgi:hypothetical protein